jgi:hypothetical protein
MVVKMSMFSGCDALNTDTVHFLEILESTYKSTVSRHDDSYYSCYSMKNVMSC